MITSDVAFYVVSLHNKYLYFLKYKIGRASVGRFLVVRCNFLINDQLLDERAISLVVLTLLHLRLCKDNVFFRLGGSKLDIVTEIIVIKANLIGCDN